MIVNIDGVFVVFVVVVEVAAAAAGVFGGKGKERKRNRKPLLKVCERQCVGQGQLTISESWN